MPTVSETADPDVFMPDVRLHQGILSEFGRHLTPDSTILDFGCGHGGMVEAYRRSGLQAFGADITIERPGQWLRPIRTGVEGYRLPYDDGVFDFVFSNSVLEHVEDLDRALSEITRVLKPGGASLHFFPPRARPIEPHVLVPLAGMLRARPWLYLWAFLGVRNSFQKGLGVADVARSNHAYLHGRTFYLSKREFTRRMRRYFKEVIAADHQMIRHSYGRARRLAGPARLMPPVAAAYGALHQRCVFCVK
jgi:SAM-dependent methyltransferase